MCSGQTLRTRVLPSELADNGLWLEYQNAGGKGQREVVVESGPERDGQRRTRSEQDEGPSATDALFGWADLVICRETGHTLPICSAVSPRSIGER